MLLCVIHQISSARFYLWRSVVNPFGDVGHIAKLDRISQTIPYRFSLADGGRELLALSVGIIRNFGHMLYRLYIRILPK